MSSSDDNEQLHMAPATIMGAMRGIRGLVLFGAIVTMVGFAVQTWLAMQQEADARMINNLGRLRLLITQHALDAMAQHFLKESYSEESVIDKLDMIVSAFLGTDSVSQPFTKQNDETVIVRLQQWRERYHTTVFNIVGTSALRDADIANIVSSAYAAVREMEEIVDIASTYAAERVNNSILINVARVVFGSLWSLVTAVAFSRTWRPYVELYHREQYSQAIIQEQTLTIQEHRVEMSEHLHGQLMNLPELPGVISSGRFRSRSRSISSISGTESETSVETNGDGAPEISDCKSEHSIHMMRSISPDSLDDFDHMDTNFDGDWELSLEHARKDVSDWLHSLSIGGDVICDGQGLFHALVGRKDKKLFEGGVLYVSNGILYRKGKSGQVLSWVLAHGEHADPMQTRPVS